ncbi:MAG: hypothetical protein J7M30_09095, partial [Deltaproteobacteria bacterium]|nr:hypothetical protein [Deltaproteobacteria bacterium]
MSNTQKQLSNPFSTGGGGVIFETQVQALFVVLMLAGGFVPCFPDYAIKKIKLQGRYAGYDTDDLIVYVERQGDGEGKKLLGQVKHSISITQQGVVFREVIQAAWNDYKNPKIFTRGKDVIALITGPLSTTDTKNVQEILEWARSHENSEEFFRNVHLLHFSSQAKQRKLEVFRLHLEKANGGQAVPDEEVFQFLRHFHLLDYDLDTKAGVTLSLLYSLIGQYLQSDAQNIWMRVVGEVQSANQSAGTITVESLPDDIRVAFRRPYAKTIPSKLAIMPPQAINWNQVQYASELAVANLVGSWNENSEADKVIVSKLAKEDFDKWTPKIREILQQPGSPVSLKNGIWSVTERKELWQAVGQGLFDSHLDTFKESVVAVLKERDPQFELPPEERYAASIHGKVPKHSQYLRKGLAESLALLGSFPTVLTNCSTDKPQTIALLSVRDMFDNSDRVLWGSLNNLLPLLAEASPNEFLSAVETALKQNPCPFDKLFAQEGKGIIGENYLTGLLWALETLAWDEQYLVRVSVILGELASHDPGGRWANRPSNSLTTIFLPWFPQTVAPIEKRKVAIQTLQRENPKAAWKLLLSLLPHPGQSSLGSSKPRWRMTIPEDWPKKVTQKEYWDQVTLYADMTIEMAEHDVAKLEEITGHLDDLPPQSLERVLERLSLEDITGKPESERMALWTGLTELVSKHERFADAKWALSPDLVSRIKQTANKLAPQNRLNLYRRLFTDRDIDLFEEKGNLREQEKILEERRQLAIKEILDNEGSEAVLRFADMVESPWKVGLSLGFIADSEMDSVVLPNLLEVENKNLVQLASGFVCGRHASRGWVWVDAIDITGWSHSQIGQFLTYLPFTADTWKRSKEILNEFEVAYWSRVGVNPYQAQAELYEAIDKLLEYGRPNAAIQCLYRILHDKQPLDKTRTIRALLSALSPTEPVDSMDGYYIVEIIKSLQDDPTTNPTDLARVEWDYLPLLERDRGASPKSLESRLASDPGFFCEVIRHVYRSKKEPKSEKKHSEREKAIAQNAYQLLHEWRTPPGMQPDGSFSRGHLTQWLQSTKAACIGSGHLEVALTHVGQVLFHCPPDPDGLWINRAVAEVLNSKDADETRNGFATAIFNSRGV